jgi:hypothetical protein
MDPAAAYCHSVRQINFDRARGPSVNSFQVAGAHEQTPLHSLMPRRFAVEKAHDMTVGQTRAEHSLYHVWLGATDDEGRDFLARMTAQEAAQLEECAGDHEIWSSVDPLGVLDRSTLTECAAADREFSYAEMVAAVRDTATLLSSDGESMHATNTFREMLREQGVDLDRVNVAIQVSVKHGPP